MRRASFGTPAEASPEIDYPTVLDTTQKHRPDTFVTREGTRLSIEDDRYQIEGANTYYLMVYAADPSLRGHVDAILDTAVDAGLNTIRTWAFNDGADEWNALQPAPGEFDESILQGLDYVVEEAGRRDLRLILPLVNYWPNYGGMDQYVSWSPTARVRDDFYTDEWCRAAYRTQMRTIVDRTNTRTGIPYREDPTSLAWELANEPRCPSDSSGWKLFRWIDEMAETLDRLAPNQLVAVGLEGFFGPWHDGPNPPRWPGGQGTDFCWHHEPAAVDLATFNLYPDHWWMHPADGISWIRTHIRAAQELEKPVVVDEYGKRGNNYIRQRCFRVWHNVLPDTCPSAGRIFWALYHREYPDYDGFGVYPGRLD